MMFLGGRQLNSKTISSLIRQFSTFIVIGALAFLAIYALGNMNESDITMAPQPSAPTSDSNAMPSSNIATSPIQTPTTKTPQVPESIPPTSTPSNGGGIRVTGISAVTDITIAVGDWSFVSGHALPLNASNRNLMFYSSDENIATVGDWGEIIGVSAGIAIITVMTEDGGFTTSFTVTVVP